MALIKIKSESMNLADDYAFTGTVTGAGTSTTPAFMAYRSSTQTGIADATPTKCIFDTERFDTDNCYDTSNGRFTPNVAGKYYVYAVATMNSNYASNVSLNFLHIRKNGTNFTQIAIDHRNVSNAYVAGQHAGLLIEMNGTTDYIEVYGYTDFANNNANNQFQGDSEGKETFFGAFRIAD